MQKLLPFILLFFVGFSGLSICEAQSLVGKWKAISIKNYYSPEYAKKLGRPMDDEIAKGNKNGEIIFNADHTYSMNMSMSKSPNVITMNGVWEASGDQLKLTLEEKYNPGNKVSTVTYSIHGNTMESTLDAPPPAQITKSVSVFNRL